MTFFGGWDWPEHPAVPVAPAAPLLPRGSLRTRAVKEGDDYVVTGNKTWITHAARADLKTLLVRTNPAEAGYKGLFVWVLASNPARKFYERLGIAHIDDWVPYRVRGEVIDIVGPDDALDRGALADRSAGRRRKAIVVAAVAFDLGSLETRGRPQALFGGLEIRDGRSEFALASGTLAYALEGTNAREHAIWVRRDGGPHPPPQRVRHDRRLVAVVLAPVDEHLAGGDVALRDGPWSAGLRLDEEAADDRRDDRHAAERQRV